MPRMLSLPSVSNVEEEIPAVAQDLKNYSTANPQAFRPLTVSQLADFNPNSPRSDSLLYFSADQMWDYYVSTGRDDAIDLCKRATAVSYVRSQDFPHRRNAMYLWLGCTSVGLIPITDINVLISEIVDTLQRARMPVDHLRITTVLFQAHVGIVRSAQASKDLVSIKELLQRNRGKLTALHEEYRRRTEEMPDDRTADERNAWTVLLSSFPIETPRYAENAATSLLQQGDLAAAIQAGNHGGVFAYVSQNCDRIKRQLQARLEVTFSPEDAIFPEFVVYVPAAQHRGQEHPMFIKAVDHLKRGDYETADALFDRLSREVEGKARDICRNFRGYTRGKQGELAEARRLLRDLPDTQFNDASAYWNYACFTPDDQPELQLKALESGIRNAPQPLILKGLIYLATLLDDTDLLRGNLLLTTISEAILLSFYLEYDDMSVEQRELAIGRLNVYRRRGEPVVPDPLSDSLPLTSVNRFMDELLEREQAPAFEYWLASRPSKVRRTLNHLSANSDYLFQTNQIGRSLSAFREELKTRLGQLERRSGDKPFFVETTQRAARWLAASMNPEHREAGTDIYRILSNFDERVPRPRFRVAPDVKKIRDYFGQQRTQPALNTAADGRYSASLPASAPESRPIPLESLLATAGQELFRDLRDVRALPKVRLTIDKVHKALRGQGKTQSASHLFSLNNVWEKSLKATEQHVREQVWQEAGAALADFESAVKLELEGAALDSIQLCLQAFRNVNRSVVRFLDVLPTLTVTPFRDQGITISSSSGPASFILQVSSNKSTTVRLTRVAVETEGVTTGILVLDDFATTEVLCSAGSPALLTLSVADTGQLKPVISLAVDISYQFEGETVRVTNLLAEIHSEKVELQRHVSPFVYGRKIEKFEIAEHFFGREMEQQQLLDGIVDKRKPRLNYVEGIRRSGKSSLLESVQFIIEKDQLPLVTVWVSFASSGLLQNAGVLIYELLRNVCQELGLGECHPDRDQCISDPSTSLRETLSAVSSRLAPRRLVIILDDLQTIEDMLAAYRGLDQPTFLGFVGFLNYIWENARPNSNVGWILSGHRRLPDIHAASPEVLLWDALRRLPVGFFDLRTVDEVLRRSLNAINFIVPDQTVARVHELTSGYPEIVQMVGERMFEQASLQHRTVLTPHDALEASTSIASTHTFETTWYPRAELTDQQQSLLTAFVSSVPLGGSIEAYRLLRQRALTPDAEQAILDLVSRQILVKSSDGVIKIKAHTLEVWLRRALADSDLGSMNGLVAVFVDLANLTHGKGSTVIRDDDGAAVQVSTVLERLEEFAYAQGAGGRGPRWAINFPPGAPAVAVCSAHGYLIKDIPELLHSKAFRESGRKGDDDIVLREQIAEVELDYPRVTNYVLVTGDIDYSLTIKRLLDNRKRVWLFSWQDSMNTGYETLARNYRGIFTLSSIESLISSETSGTGGYSLGATRAS